AGDELSKQRIVACEETQLRRCAVRVNLERKTLACRLKDAGRLIVGGNQALGEGGESRASSALHHHERRAERFRLRAEQIPCCPVGEAHRFARRTQRGSRPDLAQQPHQARIEGKAAAPGRAPGDVGLELHVMQSLAYLALRGLALVWLRGA